MISGGFGYRYPPIVRAIDECQYGSGATLSSELGELSETFVTFEDENDFEDYEICPDTTVGYGRNWGPDGEDLGPWEPETYTNVGKDPIREEIDAYQKSLLKTSNPFWTTKSTPPKSITAEGKKYNIPYVVTDFRWSDFMNLYAISPVPPSNVSGSDEAGKLFVFDWDGSGWIQRSTPIIPNQANMEQFGFNVDVSDDGFTIAASRNSITRAFVFDWNDVSWDIRDEAFGDGSVSASTVTMSLSGDGNKLFIANPHVYNTYENTSYTLAYGWPTETVSTVVQTIFCERAARLKGRRSEI